MNRGRLSNGVKVAGASAILLFVFMFFHWFGVKLSNNSNLLFAIQGVLPGKSAWEALDYIPIVLLIAIISALAAAVLRLTNAVHKPPLAANAVVAVLGIVSALLILFRILDPPNFGTHGLITYEATVQFPIFLALLAAAGIALGGYLAMREEGISFSHLRAGRHRG